jgi:hypothetical protein
MLAVRNTTGATLTDTAGDYSGIGVNDRGYLVLASTATTGSLPRAEDAAHVSGDTGFLMLGVRADTDAAATSATGDYGFLVLDSHNRAKVVAPITTPTVSAPAADARASASIALAAGFRHVCRSLSFGIHTVAAPAATTLNVTLRDGATGAGTVIRQWGVRVPATADTNVFHVDLSDLSLAGTAGTAMTLEFSAALTGTVQWCNLRTYDIV